MAGIFDDRWSDPETNKDTHLNSTTKVQIKKETYTLLGVFLIPCHIFLMVRYSVWYWISIS